MGYYLDLKEKNINGFKERLINTKLLPSQEILKEKIDERFGILIKHNLKNLFDIQQILKTKDKVQKFADLSGLPVDYLTILRREVNSYHPQPRKINEFSCIKPEIKAKLKEIGIKDTVQLFDRIATKNERTRLIKVIAINNEDALLLAKLTDFSRMRYVNQTFATLLVNSNYDTIKKIKNADYEILYNHLTEMNKGKKYFNGNFALSDIKLFVEDASYISSGVEI